MTITKEDWGLVLKFPIIYKSTYKNKFENNNESIESISSR